MLAETNPQFLPLDDLARRCAQETDRYYRRQSFDPSFCFELFQRAFANISQAWDAIFGQYQSQVAGWVRKHPSFESTGEEIQYFVIGAFAKFWNAMMPEKHRAFSDLGKLLRYLQLCVHSVISDYNRSRDLADPYDPTAEIELEQKPERRRIESDVLNGIRQQKCLDWINERLHDDKERLVLKLYVDDDLKPREIYARCPDKFQDVDEVYRIRQNIVARLARDPEFDQACGEDD